MRYEVHPEGWTWERAAEELASEGRAMAVVNTRADALTLYEAVGGDALHLSTSMCQAHRLVVLQDVRQRLSSGASCLLISTQLVEAGVDLDFDTVFRAYGPLDSIVQAAGRCNREGKLTEGRVAVFQPAEGTMPPGEYRTGSYMAANILRRDADLHDPGIFREYFQRLYQAVSTDAEGIQPLRLQFDYPEVAQRFRLVEDGQQDVIVEYDARARALVDRIRFERELQRGDFRRLQPYVVGLYPTDFERAEGSREEIAEGVWAWTGDYDNKTGLQLSREETR